MLTFIIILQLEKLKAKFGNFVVNLTDSTRASVFLDIFSQVAVVSQNFTF